MDSLNEVPQHRLGHLKIGNHAVAHGPDRHDIAWRAPQHVLGFGAHRQNTVPCSVVGPYRHHRRFTQHNAFAFDVYQCIGRSQINRQITGEKA